jgi:hypothetical protein
MTYLLITQFLNGTVTIGFQPLAIKADNFSDAIKKVKNLSNFKLAINITENEKILSFNIPNETISVFCYIKNEELMFL